jgi:ADP-ribosyl-[dinitrogen reductase] hydrolase
MDLRDAVYGCLLGGAAGDALGAPLEFMSWPLIAQSFGPDGVSEILPPGHFTDDTQMTLFTCEGLIRASIASRMPAAGDGDPIDAVHRAYLRWLHTQGADQILDGPPLVNGWLMEDRRLYRCEAPGHTCLSALRSGARGSVQNPINDSKGCGGVMRAAPAGLIHPGQPGRAYDLGCQIAAVTHGHPGGWEPAGCLAAMVAVLAGGGSMRDAATRAVPFASPEVGALLSRAIALAEKGLPTPEGIASYLGGGWVGDEALAISVCCALAAPDFRTGVVAAANHSGDSDSTGSICGNLLGVGYGLESIPPDWLADLDSRDLVENLAADLARELIDPPADNQGAVPESWWSRYPGP